MTFSSSTLFQRNNQRDLKIKQYLTD
jgi:hypothetical protein